MSLAQPCPAAVAPADRIVAVGDVHGDFTDLCLILRRTQLVDEQNHWVGGSATLVQTGDLIDRGAQGRESMDLLMALQTEASKAGGNVVPLLGNHEVMNILGDLRYVTQPNYAAFADSESEKRRKAGYDKYAAWAASHAESLAAIKQPGVPAYGTAMDGRTSGRLSGISRGFRPEWEIWEMGAATCCGSRNRRNYLLARRNLSRFDFHVTGSNQ